MVVKCTRRRIVTDFQITHGKSSTYENHQCRCDLCKEAIRLKMQKYRKTESGKAITQNLSKKRRKLETLSLQYVRDKHPAVYKRLQKEADND
jgi:hypothetical protein